jgi:hypothetical protein
VEDALPGLLAIVDDQSIAVWAHPGFPRDFCGPDHDPTHQLGVLAFQVGQPFDMQTRNNQDV